LETKAAIDGELSCAPDISNPSFSVLSDTDTCAIAHIANELLYYDGAIFAPPKFA